ncbi:MAG TPA: hypothetical protein VEI97_02760 [bacterium]|nr:hypothetical protein [bacterium]
MDTRRSLYDQSQLAFWGLTLAATVWILGLGMELFHTAANGLAGLVVPSGLFYLVWTVIWYYLRDQRNPLCFLGNLCALVAMAGYVMWGLGIRLLGPEFEAAHPMMPLLGPVMGVLGAGLLVLGKETNLRLHQTSPLLRRRDSTI